MHSLENLALAKPTRSYPCRKLFISILWRTPEEWALATVRDYGYKKIFIFGPHYQDLCLLRKTIVGVPGKGVSSVIQRMWYFHHNLLFLDFEILLFWNLLKALKSQRQLETDIYLLNENKDQSLICREFASIMLSIIDAVFLNYFQLLPFLKNYYLHKNLIRFVLSLMTISQFTYHPTF